MALVVESTLPYSTSDLYDGSDTHWSQHFPLIDPDYAAVQTSKGQTILVKKSSTDRRSVAICVVSGAHNVSNKLLDENKVAAFAVTRGNAESVDAISFEDALTRSGLSTPEGILILKTGSRKKVEEFSGRGRLVQVELSAEVESDHLLSLLLAADANIKSLDEVKQLIREYLENVQSTTSFFHSSKTGGNPSRRHDGGTVEIKSAKETVEEDLASLQVFSTNKQSLYSVHCADINGLSKLESQLLTHEISEYLAYQGLSYHLTHSAISHGSSLSRGFSISICPLPTDILAGQVPAPKVASTATQEEPAAPTSTSQENKSLIQLDQQEVRRRVLAGCESIIANEPVITEYDTIVGDGDCGYTLRDGAKQVSGFIARQRDLSNLSLTLDALIDELEVTMGGTSGALYCIFLSSLAQSLRDEPTFPDALVAALNSLLKYTKARMGDRTCIDCLMPFVETLKATGDADEALQEATAAMEKTGRLEATLGRSAYLDEAATKGVPDPGAFGLLKLLEGMVRAQL